MYEKDQVSELFHVEIHVVGSWQLFYFLVQPCAINQCSTTVCNGLSVVSCINQNCPADGPWTACGLQGGSCLAATPLLQTPPPTPSKHFDCHFLPLPRGQGSMAAWKLMGSSWWCLGGIAFMPSGRWGACCICLGWIVLMCPYDTGGKMGWGEGTSTVPLV